ncbi:MAG: VWA domain-containing protein [bacterium]
MLLLRFAYPNILYFFIPLFLLGLVFKWKFGKKNIYSYSLGNFFHKHNFAAASYHRWILYFLRLFTLLILIFLIARPQWVDSRSKINVEGIDIALVLDVSGSMQLFDDINDRRPRIDVVKSEAIRFIEKRTDDPISVVIFGRDAISLCPLTLDKQMLKNIVGQLNLGFISPEGTSLGTGLATAVNRLKDSKAKSKIIILLTDGEPTEEKISPDNALELAKQFEIKIYTVGIGNEKGSFIKHPLFGVQSVGVAIDMDLLKRIAAQTGGACFRANNPTEMREIYNKIDSLEKTEYQTDVFQRYYEAFFSFFWILLFLFGLELFLRFFVWRGV